MPENSLFAELGSKEQARIIAEEFSNALAKQQKGGMMILSEAKTELYSGYCPNCGRDTHLPGPKYPCDWCIAFNTVMAACPRDEVEEDILESARELPLEHVCRLLVLMKQANNVEELDAVAALLELAPRIMQAQFEVIRTRDPNTGRSRCVAHLTDTEAWGNTRGNALIALANKLKNSAKGEKDDRH